MPDSAVVNVCGLGPGAADWVSVETLRLLQSGKPGFLRTRRHPSADLAAGYTCFDHLYESAESFAEVYDAICKALIEAAQREGEIVYAVPGSPLVLERSVQLLRDCHEIQVVLWPAMSFLDVVWERLRLDPIEAGVRLVDGHRFGLEAAAQRGPLLVAHVHNQRVLSDIKLAVDADADQRVVLLQGLGTEDEIVVELEWSELDRSVQADHLTCLYIPELARPVNFELARSLELVTRLRAECPWDQKQDHDSLRQYLASEAAEVLEALDDLVAILAGAEGDLDDAYWALAEELGDLWFQILFHTRLAAEAGRFEIDDVARILVEKMVHRHPHVYGDAVYDEATAAVTWQRLKAEETLLKAKNRTKQQPDPLI